MITIAIDAQLISTETGTHVWADRFESDRSQLGSRKQLDTSKYRVSCGRMAPEGREAVTDRCRSRSGGVDLRREDRVPRRRASVWFAQAAAVRRYFRLGQPEMSQGAEP
jgi:hypothetical protein